MVNKTLIKVRNLSYSFNDNIVLDDVSFEVSRGDFIAIVGQNGAGKSTLVKIITGLYDIKNKSCVKRFGKIAYIPQKFNQDSNFPGKVSEIFNLECCNCKTRNDILQGLGVLGFLDKQFKILSGGQQQRVLIALSMLSNPDVLILDEPTVGIDVETSNSFYKLLKKLNEENGVAILFVTHDTGMISEYFNKVFCVSNGKVCIDVAKNAKSLMHSAYGCSFHEIHHHHHDKKNGKSEGQ